MEPVEVDEYWKKAAELLELAVDGGLLNTVEEVNAYVERMTQGLIAHVGPPSRELREAVAQGVARLNEEAEAAEAAAKSPLWAPNRP